MAKERFDHQALEESAQKKWEKLSLYETDLAKAKDPYYLLFEFPYPSGDLHIGHWYAFALTDIYARLLRMQGKDVLFPMGFDAFGLPAENAAMKYGKDPKAWTFENMETMRTQMKRMGTSVDWSKEVITCDPEYYQWTQWLFGEFYKKGLAERKKAPVKWCPKDQTVLANEQVIDGACERCGTEVVEKRLTQWFMKITQYADRLLTDLEPLPWREEIKEAQRAWIGKSEGAKLSFRILFGNEEKDAWRDKNGAPAHVDVFTTRADTIYGATYLVLAPEHPWVAGALKHGTNVFSNEKEVRAYIEATTKKTERERSENKEKTGVKLEGIIAINPATSEEIPVFIADYALASYGTGAVMAVPAHDERDFEFAKKYQLPTKQVVRPVYRDPINPPREGVEDTKRDIVIVIVKHWSEDKYLLNASDQFAWKVLFTGGIEEGEDPVQTAMREVREETGYKNFRGGHVLDFAHKDLFYAAHKGVNREVNATNVLVELADGEIEEIAEEEKALHQISWKTKEEMMKEITHDNHRFVFDFGVSGGRANTWLGILMNSGSFDGRDNEEVKVDIVKHVGGVMTTNYRIRDWLISRQRYWGCPIPMVYDPEGVPHLIPEKHLPWLLPTDVDFSPHGEAPLASSKELRERVTKIFGKGWTPEYDTLDTFVDSSWYFYRYLAPHNKKQFSDAKLMKKWIPVNRYSGGSEHTTMHLLYARFFHKALADLGLVQGAEPFHERFNRGLILGPDGAKMSKSKGNVVNPDEFVGKYGSDAVRMYLAFIGPYNEPGSYPWSLDGVEAMRKFLDRIYRLSDKVDQNASLTPETKRALAKAAHKVAEDITRFKLNTAISALMVLVNELESLQSVPKSAYLELLLLLAPSAPHLAEHLWELQGQKGSVHTASWPSHDAALLVSANALIIVQVNGKKRGEVELALDASEEEAVAAALKIVSVTAALSGKEVKRRIYVPGKILNLVAL